MRARRWLRNCLLWLAAGAGGVDAAWALSCIPPHPDAKVRMQTHFAEAVAVFVGQLVEVGDRVDGPWDASAIGRLKAERWFKGSAAPEVRVLVPLTFQPGARLLVFARANPQADRLRQTMERRFYQRPDSKRDDKAVKVPDPDIPELTAAGACQKSAFPVGSTSGVHVAGYPDAVLAAWVASSEEMLKLLETMPAAGSGGRLELMVRAFDMSDFMARTEVHAEFSETQDAQIQGLKLSGPSTAQHLAVRWGVPSPTAGSIWARDRLPAGEYRLEGLQLPGYELLCGRGSGADCARVRVEDRGRVRHDLAYVPDARLQVKLVDQQGVPVQGLGLLKVRKLSADPAGLPFRPAREATLVAHPPSEGSAYHLGLSAGRYEVEWLLPSVAPGKPDGWSWERKVQESKLLPLAEGRDVAISPGDNVVTLTLPVEARAAELRALVPGCKPGGYFEASLLTEWRPGRNAKTQNVVMDVASDSCEIRYQGFAGQVLHLRHSSSPSEARIAWVELQPGQNQVELKPQNARPH